MSGKVWLYNTTTGLSLQKPENVSDGNHTDAYTVAANKGGGRLALTILYPNATIDRRLVLARKGK